MARYEKKTIKKLEKEAMSGDSHAQHALGLLDELGLKEGTSESQFRQALNWYESSAKEGHYLSALSAATIYREGAEGVDVDLEKSDFYFAMAEEIGFSRPEDRIVIPEKTTIIGKKVLIIDQEGPLRQRMHKELINFGFNPICADDLALAQDLLKKHPHIHCIFLDIAINKAKPLAILEGIRKSSLARDLPIVVVTEISDVKVIQAARKFNISAWLLKPINHKLVGQAAKRLAY